MKTLIFTLTVILTSSISPFAWADDYVDCVTGLKSVYVGDNYAVQSCIYNSTPRFKSCVIALKGEYVSDYYAVQGCLYNSREAFQSCVVEIKKSYLSDYDAVQGCLHKE